MQVHEWSDLHLTEGGLDLGCGLEQPDRVGPRAERVVLQRDVEQRRGVRRDVVTCQVTGPHVERVAVERPCQHGVRVGVAAGAPQQDDEHRLGLQVVRVGGGPAGVVEGGAVAAARSVEPRHREERRAPPRLVPPRLAPRLVGLVRATGAREHLAEAEGRLAVAGVRVQTGLAARALPAGAARPRRTARPCSAARRARGSSGSRPRRDAAPRASTARATGSRAGTASRCTPMRYSSSTDGDVGGRRGLLRGLGHRRRAVRDAGSPRDEPRRRRARRRRVRSSGAPGAGELQVMHDRTVRSRVRRRPATSVAPSGPVSRTATPARTCVIATADPHGGAGRGPASRRGARRPRGWPGGPGRSPGSGTSTG